MNPPSLRPLHPSQQPPLQLQWRQRPRKSRTCLSRKTTTPLPLLYDEQPPHQRRNVVRPQPLPLSLKKRPPPMSLKTELISATTTKKISGTCWKAGTGTSRIAKHRELGLPNPVARAEAADRPVAARIADHAATDPVAVATGAAIVMPIDHREIVNQKLRPGPLLQRPAPNPPKAVRHDEKNAPAPTDHLVNVPNRVHRVVKIAANADHVGPIAPLLPPPQKPQMNSHRVSTTHLLPVPQPNGLSEPNELSDHGRPLSLADQPEHHDHRWKTSMNS